MSSSGLSFIGQLLWDLCECQAEFTKITHATVYFFKYIKICANYLAKTVITSEERFRPSKLEY